MIRKLVRQMLLAQILSSLTVSLCLLIDNIMIGRFLGVNAIAAYGLANPILLFIGAIGSMLAAGVQVACSKSLGRGLQEETNAGYSSAIALTLGISVPFALLVLIFRSPLAAALGAGPELFADTSNYLAGFVIGAPASMGALILVPFLQMAGKSNLLITAVLGMTVGDIAFDLLSVFVFHGGMFGMGLASSLSYYVALVIGLFYFLSKKSVFKFSTRLVRRKKIAELFRGGLPSVFSLASIVILIYALNTILMNTAGGGAEAVAAYSVITTIGNASNSITTGIGGVALTLTGILFQEEDRTGLHNVMRLLSRHAIVLGVGVGVLLVIFAPVFVSLFLPEASPARDMAIFGVRMFAAGLVPSCLCGALKNAYHSLGHPVLTEIISLCEGAIFPTVAALLLSIPLGTTGVWFYFVVGEAAALIGIFFFAWFRMKRMPFRDDGILLLPSDFSVPPEDLLEADIHTVEEVASVSEAAGEFCRAHGGSARMSTHIALCIEELSSNTVQHGFLKDSRPHNLSVRVLCKGDRWVLRFRDDCRAFDPVHYVPRDASKDALGIRLVLGIADEVRYTYSLDLNNLTVILHSEKLDQLAVPAAE